MARLVALLVLVLETTKFVTNSDYDTADTKTESQSPNPNGIPEPAWSYDDEKKWPGNKCKGGGTRQSPIDIRKSQVITDFNKDFIKYGPLKFKGYEKVLSTGINNGHTVQFSAEGDLLMRPSLTGGPLKYEYRLEQLHFHWLSEHSVNGDKYPMEIHFVHVRSDLSVQEALKKSNGLSVVSVFCNVQADLDDYQLEATEEIMQYVPQLSETGDRISGIILDMTKLLTPRSSDYYTYAGSLTSPQCNEAVIWIVFSTPIYMTDAQYRIFGKIGVGRHNFRSLQKVHKHQVFSPATSPIQTPVVVVFVEKIVRIVADFFRNVTSFLTKRWK